MRATAHDERRALRGLEREALEDLQLRKLNLLLDAALPLNAFYRQKLASSPQRLGSLAALRDLPTTNKDELLDAAADGTFYTYAKSEYVRYHQTSGTRGRPMAVCDTAQDWLWWTDVWQHVLDAAAVTSQDRAFLAFSFGPFVGFWSAFDALVRRGVLAVPGGGLSTAARVEMIERSGATVLFCTPTYAMHLAESAAAIGADVGELPIEKVIVAGEPGGSLPAVRGRIEAAWRARVTDHSGATEVGPWGFGDATGQGLHIVESEFIAEFVSVDTGRRAKEGELSHLLLTGLGRYGCPVIRYRTGDLVRPQWGHDRDCRFVYLDGGVLGRADDMVVVRGVNVYPTSIEQILRAFPEVVEYRITARRRGEMDELVIEVEDHLQQPTRIAEELRLRLGLKVAVRLAAAMSLPRSEGKGKRFVDKRGET
ncbi:Phenylacetate-coenzyme A ligase [Pseudobythopirellula maris]|uniref:Phenylacetate-coenzyme A ligase n=1 Tax=Pseudobythopirellula maris TaxID=2527991 RepID=A0A5C5ZGR0_9BACT|nr:AMP-binding protein [Pseudobythopirellula maris]TWT86247.1 Phenylacetate-coenzyme A ligase [Pseudobythopirellula maris]